MRTRLPAILLLAWLVPFLGVIAPGHQRGVIGVPGSERVEASAASCVLCEVWLGGDGRGRDDSNEPSSPADPATGCAVCHFNGTLLNPPVFALPNLKPVRLDWPAADVAVALTPRPAPPARLTGRAPPAFHA